MISMLFALSIDAAHAGAKEAALRAAMDDIWEKGDLTVIDRAYAPEIAPKIKEFVVENRALYPDIKVTIDDVVIKKQFWITTWTVNGTHKDLNKPVVLHGVSVRERVGGVFVSESMYYDMKGVYDQLGFKVVAPDGTAPFPAAADHPVTRATEGGPRVDAPAEPAPAEPAPAPAPVEPAPATPAPERATEGGPR